MDTPQSSKPSISSINNNNNKLINPTSSNSPVFQDSPVFNYISNLSPIQPVKAEPGAQGFPGLSSPPLLFTSPRITSLQSLLTRKLHSSGSLEPPQDNDGDPSNSAKAGPECNNLFISKLQRASSVKNLEEAAHCSPGCIDDFLSDPYANSSSKRQSGDTSQSSGGGSASVKVKQGAHARSRINIRVVKNEVRHLGSLSRLSTENAFEVCKDGESLNEASHLERGTLRRCLFEENQRNRSDESELRNFSDNVTRIEDMAILPSTTPPGNREVLKRPMPLTGPCVSPVTESYPVAITKPLGIGLHLNSVVYPKSLDSSTSQQSSLAGLEGKTSVLTSNQSDREVDATIAEKVPPVYEERHQDKACSIATKGETKPLDIGRFSSPVLLKPDNHTTAAPLKRKIGPQTFESDEVPCKMSPKKKRKKPSNPSDDDNPKRCNCKKTKCLKLYCDCFAAGLYCSEACACQGCCNHFENEGTVLETRKQIESRNPLAFAPKIVQQVTESPATIKEVQNLSTPLSARHKSGCNCKKSMCLKKYCECYQANVGCSDGCRCEGCKNVFGIREDYRIFAGFMVKRAADEMSEAIGERRLETTNVGSNFDNSRLHNSPNLTPATPALQCSDLRMNGLKSQQPLMRYLETPDSQNDILSSDENLSTCPKNSQSHSLILQKSKESIDEGALYADKRSEETRDILESSSKTYNSRNTSDPHLMDERVVQPMSSTLRWRSSPRTPVIQPLGVKFQDLCSESKHSNMSLIEDDTPNVLKDSSTPSEPLKVSSPNKKRISAPHNPIGSSGSLSEDSTLPNPTNPAGSLKICHRFVLQSLPTFPSLTPFSKKQPGE